MNVGRLRAPWRFALAAVAALTIAAYVAACAPETFTFASPDGSSADASFDAPNTAHCDASAQPVPDNQALWVSGSMGDDSSTCARSAPCKTINAALQQAQSQGLHVVYLDNSTFTEALSLGAALGGVTIQGGWQSASGWAPICDDSVTRIEAPADAGSAAIDIQGASNVTLRLLTVQSKAAGGAGESVYAVRVMGAMNVVLDNVALYAQLGGSGAQGSLGSADSGCSPWPATGTGALGDSGASGALAVAGQDGFVVLSGGAGAIGGQGQNSLGATGACAACASTCQCSLACTTMTDCGASGDAGCSGNGGGGGQGGQGGGVSVALYVSDSSITCTGGSLRAGPGGPGGSGGTGGTGGVGIQGATGSTSTCDTGATSGTCYNNCFCFAYPATIGGGLGGDAGPGGIGGQGGGGAGGSVFLWASYGGSSVVNVDPSTLAASTFAGLGGAGGQPNGVSGLQANHP
jgi:hypothetical protein